MTHWYRNTHGLSLTLVQSILHVVVTDFVSALETAFAIEWATEPVTVTFAKMAFNSIAADTLSLQVVVCAFESVEEVPQL